jgi:5'-methylthioinosine phosphorylase
MFGIIGGTGLASIHELKVVKRELIRTPYGEPSQPLIFGNLSGKNVVFLARHGSGHTIPPHEINYRANIWALQSVGVTKII